MTQIPDFTSSMAKTVLKVEGCRPVCAYSQSHGCDEHEENLFIHEGEFVCAGCLESYDGLRWNHTTKRFEKVDE